MEASIGVESEQLHIFIEKLKTIHHQKFATIFSFFP